MLSLAFNLGIFGLFVALMTSFLIRNPNAATLNVGLFAGILFGLLAMAFFVASSFKQILIDYLKEQNDKKEEKK